MSYGVFGGSSRPDPLRIPIELRSGRPLSTEAARLERERGWTKPLAMLIARLNELAQQGGFTHQDAAALFAQKAGSGKPPRYHFEDSGEWRVDRRKVSRVMSPRDKHKPPDEDLVEHFVTLYLRKHPDINISALRREINQLYRAADEAYEEHCEAHRQQVAADVREQLSRLKKDLSGERRLRTQLTKERDQALARYRQASAALDASSRRISETGQQLRQQEVALNDLAQQHETDLAAEQEKVRQLKALLADLTRERKLDEAKRKATVRRLEADLRAEREKVAGLEGRVATLRAENAQLLESVLTRSDNVGLDRELRLLLADMEANERQLAAIGVTAPGGVRPSRASSAYAPPSGGSPGTGPVKNPAGPPPPRPPGSRPTQRLRAQKFVQRLLGEYAMEAFVALLFVVIILWGVFSDLLA